MNDFKEKMNEKIKLYSNKAYVDKYIKSEFLTEDGDADLFLRITKIDELFDSRTVGNQVDLAYEVYDFIEEKTSMLDSDTKIHLHIVGLPLSAKEENLVRQILKEHYAIQLYKVQKQYTKYRNKTVLLVSLGLLFLCIYAFLHFFTKLEFSLELFCFLFYFSLWEAMDCYLYTLSDIKSERIAITQNLLIDVDFQSKEASE